MAKGEGEKKPTARVVMVQDDLVTIESVPGRGTTASLSAPLVSEPSPHQGVTA